MVGDEEGGRHGMGLGMDMGKWGEVEWERKWEGG